MQDSNIFTLFTLIPYYNFTSCKFFFIFTANRTSFSELESITTKVVQSTQTGSLSSATGLNLDVVTVTEPTPPPVDPTGGVRATNETGKQTIIKMS